MSKKELYIQAKEMVATSNPEVVLQSLGLEYRGSKPTQLNFKLRAEERTASAYISLYGSVWKFKDFGSGESGSVVDIVSIVLDIGFLDSLKYCLEVMNFQDMLHAIQGNSFDYGKIVEEAKKRNALIASKNSLTVSAEVNSKVTGEYPVTSNNKAVQFLRNRGIVTIPEEMKIFFGEYTAKDGTTKKRFGVGFATLSGGADVHFLEPMGSFKSIMFGASAPSYFRGNADKKAAIAIFESKMDYAAARQQMVFSTAHVFIANSTSNARKVVEEIIKRGLIGEVWFFGQNDMPGYKFVADIATGLGMSEDQELNLIWYKIVEEYKKDINDLLLEGVSLKERFFKVSVKKVMQAAEFIKNNKDKLDASIQ